jgi:hypothetical protein
MTNIIIGAPGYLIGIKREVESGDNVEKKGPAL